ncbi:MAG: methyltransferase domain-containing protein [Acidobacteria bacterium]|nr:methyltransferase domain-containing protein [Acidobacteriota bacterium]
MSETLDARLARLEQERQDADRRYNDALTALDRAVPPDVTTPAAPTSYDASKLPDVNRAWDILPGDPPPSDGSLKGRLRGFIWRQIGPTLVAQRHFNAVLVDHLNRNVGAHEEARRTIADLTAAFAQHAAAQRHAHALLMQLLQTVTAYVDTKDRAIAGGQDVLNAGLSAIADTWLKRWESLSAREERLLRRLSAIDDVRETATLAQQTALSLKGEVERLVQMGATRTTDDSKAEETPAPERAESPALPAVDLDAFKYLAFEDRFRGSPEAIREGLAEYLPFFQGASDVLDIGCGRGEFLELLRAQGITARGLDLNRAMVEASRARGLDVVQADALAHVASLPDASLGGVFAAQVVEHLPPDYLARLLEAIARTLRPGGIVVLETINPACWLAFFESYIRDLSHVRPIHPETLQYLLRVSGLHDVRLRYRSPVADTQRLQAVPPPPAGTTPVLADLAETFNENMARLNARLFTFQDYAAIATR